MNCGWRLSGNTARFPICLLPCRTCFSKAPSNLAVRVNGLIPTCYLVRGNQFIQTCGPANCAGPHFPENLTGPSPRSPRAKLSAGRGRVLPPKGCEDPKGGEALRPVSPQPLRSLDALPQSQPLVSRTHRPSPAALLNRLERAEELSRGFCNMEFSRRGA